MSSAISAPPALIAHASKDAMAEVLAGEIAADLSAAIEARGRASFVVSGGSTPRPLYERLSAAPIDWSKVDIVLMDERWVAPGEAGSNESFVRETLLQGEGAKARFFGLWSEPGDLAGGRDRAEAALKEVPGPFDVALFGIGTDGHTASWFPHGQGLAESLAPNGRRVEAVSAQASEVTGDLTTRMTLTFPAFTGTRRMILLMSSAPKRQAWEAAQGEGPVEDMPVRALLRDPDIDLIAHWAP